MRVGKINPFIIIIFIYLQATVFVQLNYYAAQHLNLFLPSDQQLA
jgi:nicotinamide riboside transporter PnuC